MKLRFIQLMTLYDWVAARGCFSFLNLLEFLDLFVLFFKISWYISCILSMYIGCGDFNEFCLHKKEGIPRHWSIICWMATIDHLLTQEEHFWITNVMLVNFWMCVQGLLINLTRMLSIYNNNFSTLLHLCP